MATTLAIGPRERDTLHGLMCRRLFVLGQDPPALARAQGIGSEQLADEFAEDLRLMDDLGWDSEDARGAVELTMPRGDLARTIRRLRRDARRAPSEERCEHEPEETGAERWERFRAAVDVCEELLDLLDSHSPDEDAGTEAPGESEISAHAEDLRPFTRPSGALVLAAVERAQRHERAREVWTLVVAEHLGFVPISDTARRLRPILETLRRHGWLVRMQAAGHECWSLTEAGRALLADSPAEAETLTESPQHRAWRRAREAAAVRIDEFRRELLGAAEEAEGLGGGAVLPRSAEIFALAERLCWAAWRLASAAHCLHEWVEPGDAIPDIDENPGPSPGRRTISAWDERPGCLSGSRRKLTHLTRCRTRFRSIAAPSAAATSYFSATACRRADARTAFPKPGEAAASSIRSLSTSAIFDPAPASAEGSSRSKLRWASTK